jgi:hypothetical protein
MNQASSGSLRLNLSLYGLPQFNPMAFRIMEIKQIRSPSLANRTDEGALLQQYGMHFLKLRNLPRQRDPLTADTLDTSTAFVGNTEVSVGGQLKFNKPVGLIANRETKSLSVKSDGLDPLVAVENGIGSPNIHGVYTSRHNITLLSRFRFSRVAHLIEPGYTAWRKYRNSFNELREVYYERSIR